MKVLKKLLLSLLIITTTLAMSNICILELPISSIVEASSIKINKTKLTLLNGETYKLKISGTNKKVKWSSSSKKIATINSNGKVTANKNGTCTITAKVGGKKYKCKITVKNPTSNTVYITKTGKKYHKSNCTYLRKSKIKISLKEAKSKGYTACKICNP